MFDDLQDESPFEGGWDENIPGKWFGRGFGGFGKGGFGGGGFGPRKPLFERGALRGIILSLLKEQPRHGYDIIQELEKKFHGFYSPSPGSVYPILQMMEDQGYVTSEQENGKKVYTITKEGEKKIAEFKEKQKDMKSHMEKHFGLKNGMHFMELRKEIGQTAQLIFKNAAEGGLKDPEKMKKLQKAFANFRSEIEKIFMKD